MGFRAFRASRTPGISTNLYMHVPLVRPLVPSSARGIDGLSHGQAVEGGAGRVRKGSGPRVMAVLRNSLIDLRSFSGKASLAAKRHDMGHPEGPVEPVSTTYRE